VEAALAVPAPTDGLEELGLVVVLESMIGHRYQRPAPLQNIEHSPGSPVTNDYVGLIEVRTDLVCVAEVLAVFWFILTPTDLRDDVLGDLTGLFKPVHFLDKLVKISRPDSYEDHRSLPL
jgi:hypothetical protein